MAGKIQNGFELSKQSWGALRQNKQLLIFPLLSGIGMFIVTILFFIPEIIALQPMVTEGSGAEASTFQWILALAIFFLYYLVASIVIIFSNAALIGATMKIIEEGDASFMDGVRIAVSRFGRIFVYALISATVGVVARSISQSGRSSDNILVTIIAAIVGAAIAATWNMIMFFALPVMVIEDVGLRDSFHRALELFKKTWGEGFVGSTAIGGLSCLAYLAAFVIGGAIIALGIVADVLAAIVIGAVVLVIGVLVIGLLNGAVNGIFQTSLYHFASTGDAGPFIDTDLAREAFQVG